jgi:hemolysin III
MHNIQHSVRIQTPGEELANSISHGIGLLLSIAGFAVLMVYAALHFSPELFWSLLVYGVSLVSLYAFSLCYHSVRREGMKRLFRRLDHIAIYMLIAGTYTPVAVLFLPSSAGIPILIAVWSMAFAGVLFKIFFMGRFRVFSVLLYVAMGWLAVFILNTALEVLPHALLVWIAAGGVCYMAGLVFYGWKRMPYHHPVWHVFVLGGSVAHFIGIFRQLFSA